MNGDDKDNRGNDTSTAKNNYAINPALSLKLKYILNNTAKNTNWRFRQRVDASKKDPVTELERRVLNKLRPMYSFDNFKELMTVVARLSPFEKVKYLREIENNLKLLKE